MRRIWIGLACAFIVVPTLYVAYQAEATLNVLAQVERDRDTWQRPTDVLDLLSLSAGNTVVDFGCGAGYFALKLSPAVGTRGTVLATDIRRESLAFLWIRATLDRYRNVQVIHGEPDNPRLPPDAADAILVSNTFHELSEPAQTLGMLSRSLKPGGRLVVLDRAPRSRVDVTHGQAIAAHELSPEVAERRLRFAGSTVLSRDDRFIDRPHDEDLWWVIVARKP